MPENDLGTARARIRVDSDTRGADQASRATDKFAHAISTIASRLGRFQASMDKIERELHQVTSDFAEATEAANAFDSQVGKSRHNLDGFGGDLIELRHRLKNVSQAAAEFGPQALLLYRFSRAYQNSFKGFRGVDDARLANGRFIRSLKAFSAVGGAGLLLDILRSKFYGMGKAVQQGPRWTQQITRFAGSFRLLTFGLGLIGGLSAGMGRWEKLAQKAATRSVDLGLAMLKVGDAAKKGIDWVGKFGGQLDRAAMGAIQFAGGAALMQNAVRNLATRFAFLRNLSPMIKAGIVVGMMAGEAAIQAVGKALTLVSNLLVGVLDGVKQLAGGFLAIPGAISLMVTAMGTAKVLAKGLKDTFGDVLKADDPKKLAEALAKLPDSLKPMGQALADFQKRWKDLQQGLVINFTAGGADQLKAITEQFVPRLQNGMNQVVDSFRNAKNIALEFFGTSQTQTDFNHIFSVTAQVINQLSDNLKPLLAGFRDIAIVGADFIKNLTAGFGGLTTKFAAWASINRQNGNLYKWMSEAYQGARDLIRGIIDVTKATWTLLTLFKTNDGDNFLKRFADWADKLNKSIQDSAAGGFLKQLGDGVRGLGTDKISALVDLFKSLKDPLQQAFEFIKDMSRAFNTVFYPAVKLAAAALGDILKFLNDIGAGSALGAILGLVGAWKLLGAILGPIRNVIQFVFGAFNFAKGAQNLVLGLAGALEKLGPLGQKAGNGILSIGDKIASVVSKIALIGTAVLGAIVAFDNYDNKIRESNSVIADAGRQVLDFHDKLKDAFVSDNGIVGNNVMTSIQNQVTSMMANLQSVGSQMPSMMDHITGFFKTAGGLSEKGPGHGLIEWFHDPKAINDLQEAAGKARNAKTQFDELGISTQDLARIVAGSTSEFDGFVASLRAAGKNDAADQIQQLGTDLQQLRDDFAAAGPGAVKLSEGIKAIADSAGNSQTKLEGLKSALEGLGLLKTNEYQAAFDYAEAIKGLGDAAAQTAGDLTKFDDILVPGTNNLNASSEGAKRLFDVLAPIGDKFLALSAQGGNVNQMWQDMQPQLQGVAKAFHLPLDAVQALVGQMGAIPSAVNILVQLEGKDQVTQDLATVVLGVQAQAQKGVNVPIFVQDPKTLETQIEQVLGDIADSDKNTLKFKAALDPTQLSQLKNLLAQHGISLDGTNVPAGAQAQIPTAPVPGQPGPAAPGQAPPLAPGLGRQPNEAGYKGPPAPAAPAPTPAPTPGKPAAAAVDQTKQAVDGLKSSVPDGKLEFTIIAKGYDETTAVINQVANAIQQLLDKVNTIPAQFQTALSGAATVLTAFQGTLVNAGITMMGSLAAGITAGTSKVSDAIDGVLKEIDHRMPKSPPKKGPLAGRNYTDRAGAKLVSDFAVGIRSRAGDVTNSANYVAGAARSGLDVNAGPPDAGKGIQQLQGLIQFAQHISDVAFKIADTFMSAIKFISDPLGQGTFFGKSVGSSLGFRRDPNVTDKQLADKRNDKNSKSALDIIGTEQKGTGAAPGPGNDPASTTPGVSPVDSAILSKVPKGVYSQKGSADLTKGLGDCSSAVEDLVNIMDGRKTGGRQMSTANAAQWLSDHGFQQGTGGPGDFRVAYSPSHMQATLPGGTPFNWGSAAAAARGGVGGLGADDPSLQNKWFRPGGTWDGIDKNTGDTAQAQQQILSELRSGNSDLDSAIRIGQDPNSTDEQVASSLKTIQGQMDSANSNDTEAGRQQQQALGEVKDSIMGDRGFTEQQNPIDQASQVLGGMSSIAGSIFQVIQSGADALAGTADLEQMGLRGMQSTEDIMRGIDDIQKYIQLGADVAGAVSNVASAIGSIAGAAGGADPSGGASGAAAAIQGVAQIAGLVQSGLETVNAVIDLGQEAWRQFGTLFGPILGQIAGNGSQLMGNVKFLLDQNTGQLLAYSADNPYQKFGHDVPGMVQNPNAGQQQIGNINVYGGPGVDPRDQTRQMMYQVKASQFAGATSQ